ncbi:MAG: SH3 domain-containing protein [Actinomycetota bacterium]|nr:SH3 domain-containing protein [Actinomycetota bacterium]
MAARSDYSKIGRMVIPWLILLIVLLVIVSMAISSLRESPKKAPQQPIEAEEEKPEEAEETSTVQPPKKAEPVPEHIGKIEVVIESLNFRDGPSAESNIIGTLKKGTELLVVTEENGWYGVIAPDGQTGYVSSGLDYIRVLEMKEE